MRMVTNKLIFNVGTKCNSLTQQFIGISTTIDTWATCFDSYRVIFRPSNNTDTISKVIGSVFLRPEDDSIGVETCSPCIYGYRYTNKLLCQTVTFSTLIFALLNTSGWKT